MRITANLKTVTTPLLDIGYFDLPADPDSHVAILLHGWPDDPHSWAEVAQALNATGWRVLAPYLRGYGPTRFLSRDTPRTGDPAALADDTLAFASALKVDRFAVIGHDWGARTAYTLACAAPGRISHCIALSIGWGPVDPDQPLTPDQIRRFWYQWFLSLDRGADLLADSRALAALIWQDWSVARAPGPELLDRLAECFRNPDWADVVLHYYRTRWGKTQPDPKNAATDAAVKRDPRIEVPTLCLHGGADPCVPPESSAGSARFFTGPYARHVLDGIGHFPQFEAPEATAALIARFLSGSP